MYESMVEDEVSTDSCFRVMSNLFMKAVRILFFMNG